MDELKLATSYNDFDTEAYYKTYRVPLEASECEQGKTGVQQFLRFILDSLHELFSRGLISGDRLLDVGTGASLLSFLSASRHVKEVHLSDLLPRHLELLQNWLEGEDREHNIVEYVLQKENTGTTVAERYQELRRKVSKIRFIDVTCIPPMDEPEMQFDILTSSFCLETAAKTVEEYKAVVKNVATLVKPGGFLVLVGTLKERFYVVGDYKFWNASVEKEDVISALNSAGFATIAWLQLDQFLKTEDQQNSEYCAFGAAFVTAVRKR